MKNNRGFTIVELLVSMIVSGILILTIVYISSISRNSYQKVLDEAAVFDDITYGFKLMQNRVHQTSGVTIESATGSWASQKLVVENGDVDNVFGLYDSGNTIDFVYLDNKDYESQREVLFSIPIPSTETPNLTFSQNGKALTAHFTGTKNKIKFDLTTTIQRRV